MPNATTAVVFRVFSDGEVIALFPYIPWAYDAHSVQSYVHRGQHVSASPSYVVRRTRPATPDEFADLKSELENLRPHGYILRVLQRFPANAYGVRLKEVQSSPDNQTTRQTEGRTFRGGDVVQSLSCIDDATPEYRRVVRAELALEEMATQARGLKDG